MEQVIVGDGSEEETRMLLRELGFLKLGGLPKLTRFCTCDLIECPALEELQIKNCPALMTFVSSSASESNASSSELQIMNSTLFDEKVLFPNLENLQLTCAHKLENIWNDELQVDSFCRLKVLKVEHGKELLKVFPSKQLLRFKNLERLMVNDCNLVEEVFDLQVLMKIQEETDVAATTETQLRYFNVTELPNLKNMVAGWRKLLPKRKEQKQLLSLHLVDSSAYTFGD
ncbi:hypothetical protein JCGZ_05635 [Jatropha curcas]|uniref:Disease resistance protein At4g27190-like leucine-rich repeats domain-containing protein n=1 Tax=Jatropha curcas TaxID=180498 RepID=A0A067LAC8_JATCU|nr:hypothetical protein JCGZ_24936 [Jatropha curcas]KDP44168.1 hypothetical protein JCGZ_05635 [Jatropha curcas]